MLKFYNLINAMNEVIDQFLNHSGIVSRQCLGALTK
jgi:hypothetical protein